MTPDNKYYWECLKENDGSDVYRINIGCLESMITLLYGENTLSVRKFSTAFNGGDVFFFKIPIEQTSLIIDALVAGHNLNSSIMPIHYYSTIKIKTRID